MDQNLILLNLFKENFFLREVFYEPLLNALVWFHETIALKDLGLAIILLTILVRILLYPLFHKSAKSQRIMQGLQPELIKIKKKYKNDREAQTKATLALFRQYKFNPLTSFLLPFVQLPILLALFVVFISDLTQDLGTWLYSFTPKPEALRPTFFGLISLKETSPLLAGLTAAAQYIQGRLSLTTTANPSIKFIVYLLPVIVLAALLYFPAALGLYWLTTTIFSIIQQVVVNRSVHNNPVR